ncbi:hypothetical protein JW906_15490 [bacterium]|nr:hypothetical protein [bacterium]
MFSKSGHFMVLFLLSQVICLAQTDTWIYRAPIPKGRTFAGGCVLDDKFYVIGGTPATSATAFVEAYSPATDL